MVTGATEPLPLDLSGLRVAITAAAGGIGRAMADSFARCRARVFISDIDEGLLKASGHPGLRADAGSLRDIEAFMDAALAHLGGLDVLINNAGVAGPTKPLEEVTPEELEATLRINLEAQFHFARRAIPALRRSDRGSIINLSSAAGKYGLALRSPYSASKWGVIGLTKTLAIELGAAGIRVNSLLPGVVDGKRFKSVARAKAAAMGVSEEEQIKAALATTSMGCMVSEQDVANMALYLASPFGATISGQSISIDGNMLYTQ
jgi:NAD(P)-dependent dehydrogenase (short-subunit alcohol dehydrogenase family)